MKLPGVPPAESHRVCEVPSAASSDNTCTLLSTRDLVLVFSLGAAHGSTCFLA